MKRFFTANINGSQAFLEERERDHCIKVLRTVTGEEVEIVDGCGGLWRGILDHYDKRNAIVKLEKKMEIMPASFEYRRPVIATAIPKNHSRWETFLEKATEIGMEMVVPIVSDRSEKSNVRMERSRQIILSAFKQSRQLYLPEIRPVIKFADLVNEYSSFPSEKYIAYCSSEENPHLGVMHKGGLHSIVLIGPEGDFTSEEISLATGKGFTGVSLGSGILRVETAGIMACNIIQCSAQINS